MKHNSFLRYVAVLLMAGFSITALAHPGGHDKPAAPSAENAAELPATMPETLAAIQGQLALLKTALKDGKFSVVSANTLTLNQLVQHLATQVPDDRRADAKGIAERHARFTTELTRAASAGAAKAASDFVSRIESNLRPLQVFAH